jgi:mRNA interferase HigB
MRVIARRTLQVFWEQPGCSDSKQPLIAWYKQASEADWATPADVKAMYASASVIGDNRVVFNIAGNKYRLIVKINYPYRVVYVRFVGTHRQYDETDVKEV